MLVSDLYLIMDDSQDVDIYNGRPVFTFLVGKVEILQLLAWSYM